MDWLEGFTTWSTLVQRKDLPTGNTVFGVRWVDVNRGDKDNPEVRSRLVVQETRRVSTIAVDDAGATFSATPPLECVRMLLSLAMSQSTERCEKSDDDYVLMFPDISRAHPHAEITRDVYTQLPEEHPGRAVGLVGKLRVCLYGVRDAGKGFEMKVF